MSFSTTQTRESTEKSTYRYEVAVKFNRTINHPRDDVELLRSKCRLYFNSGPQVNHDVSVQEVSVDAEKATARIVVTAAESFVGRERATQALRFQTLSRYNDAEETSQPPLVSTGHRDLVTAADLVYTDLKEEARSWENFKEEKPRRHNGSMVTDERWKDMFDRVVEYYSKPDSAPPLEIDDVHVRTLSGEPAPFDVPSSGM